MRTSSLPQPSDASRSQSGHAQPFQQGQDIFNLPEEPIAEETVEAFNDELDGCEGDTEGEELGGDKRPWYRRPSPWWMLAVMPISAMALAGVTPSLLQIYTDLACREIRKPGTSSLQDLHALSFGGEVNLTHYPIYLAEKEPQEHLLSTISHTKTPSLQAAEYAKEEGNCASDPKVQVAVSKLLATLQATLGILSCITGASWASLSDRLGRRPVLAIAASAVIASYSIFICVFFFADHLPGGYWFFLVGTTIFGLLGGTAAASAATFAYIADCTHASVRARMFSLTLGLRFTGMAAGPTLCALLVRATGTPVAALVLVVAVHAAYVAAVLLVVPESLSTEQKAENGRSWRVARVAAREEARTGARGRALLSFGMRLFAFLRPLAVVKPITVTNASGRVHKDWSLTFIAISSGLASLILASYSTMFQFGAAMFGWSAIELGYWFSGIVAARALTLTLFLPLIIKIYHYYASKRPSSTASASAEPESSETALLLESESSDPSTTPDSQHQPPPHPRPRHSPAFDLAIAQASLALEAVCYALVPLLLTRWRARAWPAYVVLTVLASCGAGFGPAIQALAVDLYAGRGGTETGRLFGVLSVVQATSSQILGPTIYGLTYIKIVAVYPQGILFVSVGAVTTALLALLFVELPGSKRYASCNEVGDV